MKKELGSLKTHGALLGLSPRSGNSRPFPNIPGKVFALQVNGLAKRLRAIKCENVTIGISGGLDSALALLVINGAFDVIQKDKAGIHAYSMPGFGTSERTKSNAERFCEGLGIKLETISIEKSVKQHLEDIGHDGVTQDVTYENAQARMRTMILMDKANMTNGIVVGTGDMSEIALGWSTFNGDHMSMFAVNNGVPKTVVRQICEWWLYSRRNDHSQEMASQALTDILATPISPELIPGQLTEDKLGPYELHDFFLWNFIVNEMGPERLKLEADKYFHGAYSKELIEKTLKTFFHRFFTQAFKRNCQPDGVKIFSFELSPRDWWIPSDLGEVELKG